jgi:hypothetical protein
VGPTDDASGDDARILELFAERQRFYDFATVRRLTGATAERLEEALTEGHVEPVIQAGVVAFPWDDVASLALERWTPRQIAQTLARAEREHALSPLNQFRTITIELPVYQIRLLHYLAQAKSGDGRQPLSVSDVLECELDMLAWGELPDIERAVAGFEAAARFPSLDDAPHLVETRCLYCGTLIATGENACAACTTLHVPAGDKGELP